MIDIKNLYVSIKENDILHGVNLKIHQGKIIALMGPNGSGKSTLSHVLMGHPDYKIEKGEILFDKKNLLSWPVHKRARQGLFLAFQYPYEIPGVSVWQFLQSSLQAIEGNKFSQANFVKRLQTIMKDLHFSENFLDRGLNEGFSGGEKKRMEILQMRLLQPKIAILDETDSGLDIDALKLVAANVRKMVGSKLGVLVITHYQRLLSYLQPDEVHVMYQGKIVKSGGRELVKQLERNGYSWIKPQNA